MPDLIRKEYTGEIKATDKATATVDAVVSTIFPDRDDEIILPSAYPKRLDVYRRNPLHVWSHDRKSLRSYIGRAVSIDVDERGLVARFEYATDVHEDARIAFGLVDGRYLNCFSIGFRPFGSVRPSEIGTLPASDQAALKGIDLSRVTRIYTDVEVLEISLCGYPSNTAAFVVGRSAEEGGEAMAEPKSDRTERKMHSATLADCCARLHTCANMLAACECCRCPKCNEWEGCCCGSQCCCCASGTDCGKCSCCLADAKCAAECCEVLAEVLERCRDMASGGDNSSEAGDEKEVAPALSPDNLEYVRKAHGILAEVIAKHTAPPDESVVPEKMTIEEFFRQNAAE